MSTKIDSGYAYVDVKDGRDEILRRVKAGERIPVTITGHLTAPHSDDDGISREFELEVESATEVTMEMQGG